MEKANELYLLELQMTDKTQAVGFRDSTIPQRFVDMGDGTFAPVVVVGALSSVAVSMANGANLSAAVDCGAGRPARMTMPAAWTAANLTFQACATIDGTFQNLYSKDGTEYTVTADAAREIILPLVDFIGIRFLKVRSGTSGSPVSQGAARALSLTVA